MAVYIGPGVLNFEGVDYGYGDTLPKGVDIDALKKSGKAADSMPAGAVVVDNTVAFAEAIDAAKAASVRIGELEGMLADERTTVVELKRDLLEAGEKIKQFQVDLETAQKTITQLMSAPVATRAPTQAGPKK